MSIMTGRMTRRDVMTTLGAGLVAGVGGHFLSSGVGSLARLLAPRRPTFLDYIDEKPSAPALNDVSLGAKKTSKTADSAAPRLLGANDTFWLVTRAYMAAVAACEGTLLIGKPNKIDPYHTAFDYRELTSLADHPRQLYPFWDSVHNRQDATTAAGAFQIIETTWDDEHRQHRYWAPGDAFSPENQEICFCYLHNSTGGSAELMDGVQVLHQHIMVSFDAFAKAMKRDGQEWASLPYSDIGKPTGQSTRPLWQAWTWFQWALWAKCGYRRSITHPVGVNVPRTDTLRWRPEKNRMHWGEDYGTPMNTPILAPENGKISFIGYDEGAGHIVCFVPEGYPELEMRSFHCTGKFPHAVGTQVKRGAVIGYTGNSGKGTGPHWHVEIRIDGHPIEPRWYLGMATWFKDGVR